MSMADAEGGGVMAEPPLPIGIDKFLETRHFEGRFFFAEKG
jgi:hypothetical protein